MSAGLECFSYRMFLGSRDMAAFARSSVQQRSTSVRS